MRDSLYLVLTRRGIVRTAKNPPSLKRGEHAVRVAVEVDDAAFAEPIPVATLRLDPTQLTPAPFETAFDVAPAASGENADGEVSHG